MMQSCPCMTSSPTLHVWGRFTHPMPFPYRRWWDGHGCLPSLWWCVLADGGLPQTDMYHLPLSTSVLDQSELFSKTSCVCVCVCVCVYICTCVRTCVAQWVPTVTCLVIMAEYMVHVTPGQCLYLRCIWYPNWNCCPCCRWAHHCHNCRPTLVPSVIRAAFPIPPTNWLYLVCNWSIVVSMYA